MPPRKSATATAVAREWQLPTGTGSRLYDCIRRPGTDAADPEATFRNADWLSESPKADAGDFTVTCHGTSIPAESRPSPRSPVTRFTLASNGQDEHRVNV